MNLEYPLTDSYFAFKNLQIIKCKEHKFIIIGWNSSQTEYRAMVIPKVRSNEPLKPLADLLHEIGPFKSIEETKKAIQMSSGPFYQKQSIFIQGIVGFHRFFQGYYLTYIKQSQAIAKIGRHKIYEIKGTQILQLFDLRSDHTTDSEKQYRRLLGEYKLENYYFSSTYDMTNTLARNMVTTSLDFFEFKKTGSDLSTSIFSEETEFLGISETFQYNHALVEEFYQAVKCKKWIISIIHGFCKHVNLKFKGTIFNLIVIGRRSRHHAGTRYIKRGINEQGFAANFVEVEQIVVNYNSSQDTRPVCSSFVQVRGSVPTYWMQKPSFAIPKPPIELRTNVDYMCVGTRKHFHDLICRYGRIIFCMNLMKQKQKTPRESELSREYSNAVTMINKNDLREENAIHYSEIDMKFELKRDKKAFVQQIKTFAYYAAQKTGLFLCTNPSSSSHQQLIQFQNGIIRANCVDCLDRTNSFQQLVGEALLVIQLNRLIGEDTRPGRLQLDQQILEVYSQLYQQMGDLISIQYGSSLAHKQKIQKTSESRFEFFTSIQRHFNNNFKDENRQTQIDVFLGFKPDIEGPQLWQIKPVIEHYPNAYTNTFQKMKRGEWFDRAYRYFTECHHFQDFTRINKREWQELNIPKMEKLTKDQLIHKFRAEIVSSMINEKEETAAVAFLVEPKIFIQQRAWKEVNPRSVVIRTLQEELSMTYNKMDFLKDEEMPGGHMPPFRPEKEIKETGKPPKLAKAPSKPEEDLELIKEIEKYISKDTMDEEELKLIQRIWQGQLGSDQQLQKNVEDLYTLVSEDIMRDEFFTENFITQADISNELRRIEVNLAAQNFIANGEELSSDVIVYRREIQPQIKTQKSQEPKKREMARQNRVKMLEQIMNKTFSHGGVTEVTEI